MNAPDYTIRKASIADLDEITALETMCFPESEAASREAFDWRLKSYPQHFLLLEKEGKIISFVNGPVTVEADLMDEMYDSAKYCNDRGDWQMIFGVVTHPDYQRLGYASALMRQFIDEAKKKVEKEWCLPARRQRYHSILPLDIRTKDSPLHVMAVCLGTR